MVFSCHVDLTMPGDRMLMERTISTNGLLRRYVYGAGEAPEVWYEGAGTSDRRFLHTDERGSVIAISDGSGQTLAINAYDEYGIPQSTNLGRFQYTGQMWLPSASLYHYKARTYSPTLGRFLQTDPIGYGDGLNWYNYVGGDPVNGSDPSGLDACNGDAGTACGPGGGGSGGGYGANGSGFANDGPLRGQPVVPSDHGPLYTPGGNGGYNFVETANVNIITGGANGGQSEGSAGGAGGTQNGDAAAACVADPSSCITVVANRGPTTQRYIQMTTLSYAHIFIQHAWFPFPDTSRFAEDFRNVNSMYGLVGKTITTTTGIIQPNGNVRYEGTLPFNVGTDPLGFLTREMTVIVRPTGPGTGDVVTAYPGR